jgi:N-acetylneuraminic acid mutarotase
VQEHSRGNPHLTMFSDRGIFGLNHKYHRETMKKLFACVWLLFFGGLLSAAAQSGVDALPDPVSNNAVAELKVHGQFLLFSFMGIGAKKTPDAITNTAFSVDTREGKWSAIHAVPGTAGRIGAMAAGVRDQLFVFGGYVEDTQGAMALPDVGMYEPSRDRWLRGADIPLAVGDSVIGVYRDRFVYLVGGRSNGGVVNSLQVYDAEKDKWSQATPIPGTPVFGHAGAMVNGTIVYVDGARKNPSGNSPRYVASDECWMGKVDHHDPHKIQWTKLPNHPGTARFRIAGGGSEKDEKIYFAGGSDNPHDYNGIGYDGKPSEPSPVTFDFNLRTEKWETLNENTPDPTMDHRGLLVTHEGLVLIGGMEKGQKVIDRVTLLSKQPTAK